MKNKSSGSTILHFIFITLFIFSCKEKLKEEDNVYYTCSMDPQVIEKKPGQCPICKMELTRTELNPVAKNGNVLLNESQMKLANIKTKTVQSVMMGTGLTLRGKVVPNDRNIEIISSRVAGRVDKLYFKNPGEKIKEGDRIYDIYSESLQASIKQYLLLKQKSESLDGSNIDFSVMLESAREKLLVWGMSAKQIYYLKDSDLNSLIPFYSNVTGVVNEILITEGNYVNEGTAILNVADYSSLWVEAEAYPEDLKYIYPGIKVEVSTEAFPNEVLKGKISFENPELEANSKVNLIRIEILNADGKLKAGMRSTVRVLSEEKNTLTVPEEAVLYQPKENLIWIEKQRGEFFPKTVELGSRDNGMVEIKSGILEGENVVISGAYLLQSEFILRNGSKIPEAHNH